ncbi:hypothetical protein [Flindersiella endophytica]
MPDETAPVAVAAGEIDPDVLAWARWRIRGPVPLTPDEPGAAGLTYVSDGSDGSDGTGSGWLLGTWPDGTTPSVIEEYDIGPVPVERSGETRRALAAALRCCWADLDGPAWPGVAASIDQVTACYSELGRGDADLLARWALGALRRLAESGWLRLDQAAGTVRLGPRVALWPDESLTPLRETLKRMPLPNVEPKVESETEPEAEPGVAG